METAGKQVDDEELRDLMKANGIGRPSTRANIIETLFKRKYTQRRKKQVIPTEMGIQLINTIQNELLKSAELTGQWEKQLKEIEQGEFGAKQFIFNMKKMVHDLVYEVRMERGKPKLVAVTESKAKIPEKETKTALTKTGVIGISCPKCLNGKILKGKSSYGCSQWKEGCDFRVPFTFMNKKISDKQVQRLIEKKATIKIKGFVLNDQKVDGILKFNTSFEIEFENKTMVHPKKENRMPLCPKCSVGTIVKGKTAYGCSLWKSGCDFRFSFDDIKSKANGQALTTELVLKIISGRYY
jgi:DNA topoisomerase-3